MRLSDLASFFYTPSSFEGDARGFALNAAGHALIVGALAAFFLPAWIVLTAYAVWEFAQWRHCKAEAWDCIHDWAFVAGGALAVSEPLILIPLAGFYAAGILRRLSTQPDRSPQ